MAVRLLAGPITCTLVDAPPDEEEIVFEPVPVMWLPGSGGMVTAANLSRIQGGWKFSYFGMMTLDGRYCDRSSWIEMTYMGWWPAKKKMVSIAPNFSHWNEGNEIQWDPISFSPEQADPIPVSPEATPYLRHYIKLADRRLAFYPTGYAETAKSFLAEVNGVVVPEGPPSPFYSSGSIHPGRTETEVFVSSNTYVSGQFEGRCIFYDTVTKQWSSPVYMIGMSCYSLVYSTDFGVLVSTHNWVSDPALDGKANQIRIWSLEVHPTMITDVAVVQGVPKSGQVVFYQVRVGGDQFEPAEGELIDWSVTGVGVVLDLQSKTDKDGYATTRVRYGVGDVGNSTVVASLRC